MYVREARLAQTFKEGTENEELTMSALTSAYGGICEKSTPSENMNQHIDIWWTTDKGNKIGIDAKNTPKYYKGFHWIEGQNVNGNKGSIYGNADYLAFNAKDKIYFVKRQHLVDIYENKVLKSEITNKKPKEFYIPYSRSFFNCIYDGSKKANDIIFKMPAKDFEDFDDTFVIKI